MKPILFAFCVALLGLVPLRAQEKRREMDEPTKKATAKALDWLKQKQDADGSFSDSRYPHNTGITGFAMLAFMAQGHLTAKDPYGPDVIKAAHFLIASQREQDGYIVGTRGGNMYCHALATLALAELCGQTGDASLAPVIRKAVDLIVRSQAPNGGWRYEPRPFSADCSITILQVMALRAAQNAGFEVPEATFKKAVAYIRSCHRANDGGFSYLPKGGVSTFANTAGAMCVFFAAGEREAAEIAKATTYVKSHFDSRTHFFHGHYHASQAMYQVGGKEWEDWHEKISKFLLNKQSDDGRWAQNFQYEVGPVYQTSIAVICLSVPSTYPKKYKPIVEKTGILAKKVLTPVQSLTQAADRLETIAAEQLDLFLRTRASIRDLEIGSKTDLPAAIRLRAINRLRGVGTEMKRQSDDQIAIGEGITKLLREVHAIEPKLTPSQKDLAKTLSVAASDKRLTELITESSKKLRTLGYPEARLKQFRLANEQQRLATERIRDLAKILYSENEKAATLKDAHARIKIAVTTQLSLEQALRSQAAALPEKKAEPKKGAGELKFPGTAPLPKITPLTPLGTELQQQINEILAAEKNMTFSAQQAKLAFAVAIVAGRIKLCEPALATILENSSKAMDAAAESLLKNETAKSIDSSEKAVTGMRESLKRIEGMIAEIAPKQPAEKNDTKIDKK